MPAELQSTYNSFYMQGQQGIVVSLIAGLVGGSVVVLLAFSHPRLVGILLGQGSPQREVPIFSPAPEFSAGISAHEERVVAAVQKANPAVVSIVITEDVPVVEQYFEELPGPLEDFFGDDFFSPFRFRVPRFRQKGTERREVGGGSGFIVSSDGLLITNRHVVADEQADYTVFTNDGTKYEVDVVARDPVNDLAVLTVQGGKFPHLMLADSEKLRVGQTVIAIGNALGEFRNTVSVGVVSGLSRSITAGSERGELEQLEEVVQTDAAINPGNSGGPLLNLDGDVVGVNVAVVLGSENIGFALPSSVVKSVVESVQATGKIVRPYLGIRYLAVTPALQERNKLPVDYGALVVRGESGEELAVMSGSPADKAGIQEGDIILEADGVKLEANRSLAAIIRKKRVGDSLRLKILHQGEEREVAVTLEEISQ